MIALDDVTVSMRAQLSQEPIDPMEVVVTYVDVTYSGNIRKEVERTQVSQIPSAAEVAICSAPPLNTTRLVKYVSICNTSSIVPLIVTVTIAHGDNHAHQLRWVPLLHNDSLCYEDGGGWYKMNAGGGRL